MSRKWFIDNPKFIARRRILRWLWVVKLSHILEIIKVWGDFRAWRSVSCSTCYITRLLVSSSTRPCINNTLKFKTELITGPHILLLLWTRFGRYVPIFKTWCRNKKESPSLVDKRHVLKLMKNYICRGVKRARTLRFLLNIQCLTVHSHLNIKRRAAILRAVVAMFLVYTYAKFHRHR